MNKDQSPLWQPSQERVGASRLRDFLVFLGKQGVNVPQDYQALHRWSIDNKRAFWQAIWQYHQVLGSYDTARILSKDDFSGKWFEGARLNFAENMLRGDDDAIAIIEHREDKRRRTLSYRELRELSAQLAGTLKAAGVGEGDRVGGFLPNGIEAVVGMLASARLGAVWSSCSPDFGLQGVLDRFGQIQPKVLIGINGYEYNGKIVDTRERMVKIVASLPELQAWIGVDNHQDCPWPDNAFENDSKGLSWEQALEAEASEEFVAVSFDSPLYILYSSGTTGAPKCIVHGVGGTLLQHLKELSLHCDISDNDVVFYYTTCGWMMWNWLVSSLALGATIVLYDGSPFAGEAETLWHMAEQEGVTVFGSSAKYYASCEKEGLRPERQFDLSQLRSVLSTGSPLSHESFDYVYRDIKADVCLSSISGGTDIVSCFALGNPMLPVYRGQLQCIGLGMDVDFVDDDGRSLPKGKGELVCRSPFPSTPVAFWNDSDGKRFHEAYFERFAGVWAHGDYGEVISHKAVDNLPEQVCVIIHGRSDAVLNPGGVRIGTAEIYRQVEKVDEVLESIAVGQTWQDDVRVVLFVRLRSGLKLDENLIDLIRKTIRNNTTPRHVPAKILQVEDIPRTISGKIVELAVGQVIHGLVVKNKDALANPEALVYFANRAELST
ncbi:MAG: acetoacetate--CoA ligase [Gammaproteobacteria bacterium]